MASVVNWTDNLNRIAAEVRAAGANEGTAIRIKRESDDRVLLVGGWPDLALITNEIVKSGDPRVVYRYPSLTFHLDNAHAVYRLDTCDRGIWIGVLVEGHMDGKGKS